MNSTQETKIKKLGVFTLEQAASLGIAQQELSRLVKNKRLKRVARGIYLHPEAAISSEVGFQIACAKFGSHSAIAGLSALSHYNLIEEVPRQIWLIVPPDKQTSDKKYRLIRTASDFEKGIISLDGYKIVSIERAILEGFKLASKIGERTAISAARTGLTKRQTTEGKLGKAAKELGYNSSLYKYFEAIAL